MDEHTPVLLEEVLAALAIRPEGLYVDATFGRGGHSARILEALGPQGELVALDRDPQAIAAGRLRFPDERRLHLVQTDFMALAAAVRGETARSHCDGIVFDLGVSSPQLDEASRGFSFSQDGPLDMRMDPTHGRPLSVWLAQASRDEIRSVIGHLGEERFAGRIANALVNARAREPIITTAQLASLVAAAVPTRERSRHPATRTFQALRMHINDELTQIEQGLAQALSLLAPGGRLAVISFHSLEDRVVKQFMRREARPDEGLAGVPLRADQLRAARPMTLRLVGRKRRPGDAEIAANPRARSALLRVAERLPAEPLP